mmetsp:Transcript_25497/g.61302  ORF Transcript_25497/g.61302 Transcript_25497/m.61302 type:complete len:1096 (+) Transcript_25497:59-3346(+)
MTTAPPTPPQSWVEFLLSPAISYVSPTSMPTATAAQSKTQQRYPRDYYWNQDLLEKWRGIFSPDNSADAAVVGRGKGGGGVSTINYGSYIVMATFIAENLSRRLSLDVLRGNASCCGETNQFGSCLRVGIAIPEGPFLPLYILAVHSLNVAVGEDWLFLDDNPKNDGIKRSLHRMMCGGVALIPMETEEAPERLRHMLRDSSPDLILVAPGKDWENMESAVHDATISDQIRPTASSIQLVDYTQLMEEALSSFRAHAVELDVRGISLVDQLWPSELRLESMDSLRYSHAVPGCLDVARLTTLGLVRRLALLSSSSNELPPAKASAARAPPSRTREIMSHIVYTSGTTGRPKGCVSSLSSLQHYIRAKNSAHGIDGRSRVLLASAITFDPCFSDILATCAANAALCLAPRERLYGHADDESDHDDDNPIGGYGGLTKVLRQLEVSHVLCTPTLWATVEGDPPDNIPSLRVVSLGGEPIPKAMACRWARSRQAPQEDAWNREYPRLSSTYGVTEACVYQTFGEVVLEYSEDGVGSNRKGMKNGSSIRPGQNVGLPLLGTEVHICYPCPDEESMNQDEVAKLNPVEQDEKSSDPVGEVVLSGAQLDRMSSYLNLPELTARVFVRCSSDNLGEDSYFYRTGDLGYIEPKTGNLNILGRIKGDGMVKINGVRIELQEVEHSIIDDVLVNDEEGRLVIDCMASIITSSISSEDTEHQHKQLVAYCVLSPASTAQLGLSSEHLNNGIIVPPGPLLSLLRARCDRRVRRGCVPSVFILINRLPLSPTGKRDRSALPLLADCCIMGGTTTDGNENLWSYNGKIGRAVANKICECLNLQPCQRQLLTLNANFFVLGGDSLAATRVVRGLYAQYHGVFDSRNLGGSTGTLGGPFATKYLLQSRTLGEYVDFLCSTLDSMSAFEASENDRTVTEARGTKQDISSASNIVDSNANENHTSGDPLYGSLVEAITLGYTSVASSLLDLGVDPNDQPNQGRLGKVTDRKQQRALFKSNPLHLASLRGNPYLVKQLLGKGCKANCPDASGSFPIHLACSRLEERVGDSEEDDNRLECVKLLLGPGKTPISIKDGNKQTILHSAARAGHCKDI